VPSKTLTLFLLRFPDLQTFNSCIPGYHDFLLTTLSMVCQPVCTFHLSQQPLPLTVLSLLHHVADIDGRRSHHGSHSANADCTSSFH
jgi:hypothetical protein